MGSPLDTTGLVQRPEIVGKEINLANGGNRRVLMSLKEESGEKMREEPHNRRMDGVVVSRQGVSIDYQTK